MSSRAEAIKAELLDQVAQLVGQRLPPREATDVERFVRHYFRDVAPADLMAREPLDLYGAALAHLRFGEQRTTDAPKLRLYNPTVEQHGWQSTHTILEIVNDDMPFLIDSVSMELSRHGLGIHLIVHPVFPVRRDGEGRLVEVLVGPVPDEAVPESFMHVEVDRQSDASAMAEVERDLERVLDDVRQGVRDWRAMQAKVEDALAGVRPAAVVVAADELLEIEAFLRWLADNHFTFLGYSDYALEEDADGVHLRRLKGSGLGILKDYDPGERSRSFDVLPPEVRERSRDPLMPLLVTKGSARSTVHRATYLDVIGVKRYGPDGSVEGEHRFLGLFTSAAYNRSPREIPLLRRKVQAIFGRAGYSPASHDGKALVNILETYPRDELFQTDTDLLFGIADEILHLQERQRIRLFVRPDPFGRFLTCLVYVPRDRYNTVLRERLQAILVAAAGARDCEYQVQLSESVLARIVFTIRTPDGLPPGLDPEDLQRKLVEASHSWTDRLRDALQDAVGEEEGNRLFRLYGRALPASYQESVPARAAVPDIRHMDGIALGDGLAMSLYRRLEDPASLVHFKLIRADAAARLADVLPILEGMGLRVLAEETHHIRARDGREFWIHDFGMELLGGGEVDVESIRLEFQQAFHGVWSQRVENDRFNRLVIAAGLDVRQVVVLRAYCKYVLQLGIPFSQSYIEETLVSNAPLAALLVRLFEARFDPERADREADVAGVERAIQDGLEGVAILDEDRICRTYLGLVQATLRTNYYQRDADGAPKGYLSLKLDPARVPGMPLPKPAYEIWVYAPQVEAVHLRGGKVARGGIRWSDRREDFRTEVLGLMKAQMVKNSVIVPVGAKGGFFVKRPPAGGDRAAQQEEAVRCYRTFLSGLLDLTDNRTDGKILPPPAVVRYDEDDPYLVVAADKGTATFSDIANGVSRSYGFWLDDAFASGGSAGYDHKVMGITAKGAWESVKRHFRELGRDIQSEPFTVVGIGDMSGDVFGNGMLLSDHIRLVAAFDHRHVFLDPDPDPAVSMAERKRLFALPRSSWADYDRALLSAGGGIFPRSLKSIEITPEMRRVLAIEAARLPPAELIRAILRAPVDLLWNGGIGTYVKAAAESHADAHDRANDAVRVDGEGLRCKVVGEGGNLGLTQHGRVAFAGAGGRINTDFIDNSAGVDCSDHEVNIKILVGGIMAAGDLTLKQRNELLAGMTEEVAALVLRDNVLQNVALSIAQSYGVELLDAEMRLMRKLERQGRLDRAIEMLPGDEALAERRKAGQGLTRPESAVLLAYAKMTIYDGLLATDLPDRPYFGTDLAKYFPRPLRRRFGEQILGHRLRRELVATALANSLVNRGLHVIASDLEDEAGASLGEIALGYVLARDAYDILPVWGRVEALPAGVPVELQLAMLRQLRRVLVRGTRWFLANGGRPLRLVEAVGRFRPGIGRIVASLETVLGEDAAAALGRTVEDHVAQGVEATLARSLAALPYLLPSGDVVLVARRAAGDQVPEETALLATARVYFALDTVLGIGWLRERLGRVALRSGWDRLALAGQEEEVSVVLRRLAVAALAAGVPGGTVGEAEAGVDRFLASGVHGLDRYRRLKEELGAVETLDLTALSVAVRALAGLVTSG